MVSFCCLKISLLRYKEKEDVTQYRKAGNFMREQTERWMKLCEQACTEQDPQKLLELVREINDLLEKKQARLAKEASKK